MSRPTIKGQALIEFLIEFTTLEDKRLKEAPVIPMEKIPK